MKTLKPEAVYLTEYDSYEEVAADLPRFHRGGLQRPQAALRLGLSQPDPVREPQHAHPCQNRRLILSSDRGALPRGAHSTGATFLYVKPALLSTRQIEDGCTRTPCSASSAVASSVRGDIGHPPRRSRPGSPHRARACPAPAAARSCAAAMSRAPSAAPPLAPAVLGLTPKCRDAARREPPRAMTPEIRSRKSSEYAPPMIHLR